jgi:hypothetical protein
MLSATQLLKQVTMRVDAGQSFMQPRHNVKIVMERGDGVAAENARAASVMGGGECVQRSKYF